MLTAAQPAVEEVTRLHAECSRLRAELEAAKKREEALDDELHALSLRVLEPLAPALDSLADLKFDPAALEKANAEIATLRARIEAGVAAATPVAALAAAEAQPADARKVVDEQAEALARKDALLDLFAGEDTTLQTAAELEVGKRMMDEKQIAKMEQNAASLAMVHPIGRVLADHVCRLAAALREAVKERNEARRLLAWLDHEGVFSGMSRDGEVTWCRFCHRYGCPHEKQLGPCPNRIAANAAVAAWKAKEDAKP